MATAAYGLAKRRLTGVSVFRPRELAALFGFLGLFAYCGQGVSYAAPKTTATYYPASGYAADVGLAKSGEVVVSLGQVAKPLGLQVYKPANGYKNPCGGNIINLTPMNITAAFGFEIFPDREQQKGSKTASIGLAVESNGVEFLRANLGTCNLDGNVNVPQLPVNAKKDSPGTFGVAITPKGQPEYAFVANEYGVATSARDQNMGLGGTVGIIKVQRTSTGKFTGKTQQIPLNGYLYVPGAHTIPGVTMSQDGRYLFVTNEGTAAGNYPPNTRYAGNFYSNPTNINNSNLSTDLCVNEFGTGNGTALNGALTVIDVKKAISGWGQASIVQTIAAGCSPVRAVESADGRYVFVATRGGNPGPAGSKPKPGSVGRILVFDREKLVSQNLNTANNSLVGIFNSGGTQPVGMTLFNDDQLLAVANSNRYVSLKQNGGHTGKTTVAIFDVSDPRKPERKTVCKSANPASFPRGVTADGLTLYVANFGSLPDKYDVLGALEVINYVEGDQHRCRVGPYPTGMP